MKTRAELKAMAKEQIRGKIGILFVIMLIVGAISFVTDTLIVGLIITPAFMLSTVKVYLNIVNGNKPVVKDAFSGFDDLWTAFKTSFFTGLFTFLWSLLLVIPGIIKAISYSQAMLIVAENPGIGAREAINRSKAMMEGHKKDYFVLGLSFIGWFLLGAITFGIAYIWIIPYVSATQVNFYNELKAEKAPIEESLPAIEE